MPVEFVMSIGATYDPDVKQLIFKDVFMPAPGHTMLLVLMANGSYSGVDLGPLAGQYTGEWPVLAVSTVAMTTTTTVIPVTGVLETWPAPSPPYTVSLDADNPAKTELATLTAIDRVNHRLTVTRTAPQTHTADALISANVPLVDDGATPPLLYIPGEPTAAPAKTGAWWAHIVSGSADPAFALWQSRYWQSAPQLPVGHPTWATLSILARKLDGTEWDTGLADGWTNEVRVAVLGTVPSPILFQPRGMLLAFTETVEILPLPEVFGDIAPPANLVTPSPGFPPFSWYYPMSSWTPRLVGSLPNNNEDLWLPILVSSKRSTSPSNAVEGWDDATGAPPPVAPTDPLEDLPIFWDNENWFSTGSYAVRRQIASGTFTSTHDPNPIAYDLTKVGAPQFPANVAGTGLGSSREPCVGQNPWWELAGIKPGPIGEGFGTVSADIPDSTDYTQQLHTGNIMLLVAQSEGLGVPTDPAGWTRIDAVCGPNAYSAQPVVLTTFLWETALAGATTIKVAMNSMLEFGEPPFTVAIEGGPPLPPPAVTSPPETVTAVSCDLTDIAAGYAVLGIGALGADHFGGRQVVLTVPSLPANDQYVAAWWKVAEGSPPDTMTGVPSVASEGSVDVAFPGGERCTARMYAIMADQTDPFSVTSTGAPAVVRVDIPPPAAVFVASDVIAEDGITLRAMLALTVGARHIGGSSENLLQDIRHLQSGTFMLAPVANPFLPNDLPPFSWNGVDPASVAVSLCFAFRGLRERPPYELVDGHFAPTFANRGALPPCAGAGLYASDDMRSGIGIRPVVAVGAPNRLLLSRTNMSGNIGYLRAWVSAGPDALSVEVEAYITVDGIDTLWFSTFAAEGFDFYADPPDAALHFAERPFSVRFTTNDPLNGYYGLLVWSEEDCQGPTAASYGLTAAFRYKHQELHSASSQQASIVG